MSTIHRYAWSFDHWPPVLGILLCCFLTWLVSRYISTENERPIKYDVSIPEQCKSGWKGRILDDPSIKVWFSLNLPLKLTVRRYDARVLFNATAQQLELSSGLSILLQRMASIAPSLRPKEHKSIGPKRILRNGDRCCGQSYSEYAVLCCVRGL